MHNSVAHAQQKNLGVRVLREHLIRRFQNSLRDGVIAGVYVDCDYLSGVLCFEFLSQKSIIKFVASLCDIFRGRCVVD